MIDVAVSGGDVMVIGSGGNEPASRFHGRAKREAAMVSGGGARPAQADEK